MKKFKKSFLVFMIACALCLSVAACNTGARQYLVSYYGNFPGAAPIVRSVAPGEKAEDIEISRKGYDFGGWYTEPGCKDENKFSFDTKILKDYNLYAKWVKTVAANIIFDKNGGEGTMEAVSTAVGKSVKLPECGFTLGGYVFGGWSDGKTVYKAGENFTVPSASVTLTAQWLKKRNVTFSAGGAAGTVPEEREVTSEKFVLPEKGNLVKEGYAFGGWSDGKNVYPENAEYSFYGAVSNISFTAVWAGEYTVNFSTGYDGGTVPESSSKNTGDAFALPAELIRNGMLFDGWSDGTMVYHAGANYTVGYSDVTLTALWAEAAEVKFQYNYYGNDSTYLTDTVKKRGLAVKPQEPDRPGHEFLGWYKDAAGQVEFNFFSDRINDDVLLYAKWRHEYFDFIPVRDGAAWEINQRQDIVIPGNSAAEQEQCEWYKHVEFPSEYDGKPVIGIKGSESFDTFYLSRNLESITVPDSYEYIGKHAFTNCYKLTTVTFSGTPKIKEIGEAAFQACRRLNNFALPASVETLGVNCFMYCYQAAEDNAGVEVGMTAFTIPEDSKLTEIPDWTFARCKMLTDIRIPAGIKKIGRFAFNQCRDLNTVTFPEGLEEIGEYAFGGCMEISNNSINFIGAEPMKFENVVIPSSVKTIGAYSFAYNPKLSITFAGESSVTLFGRSSFYGSGLTSINIPKSVVTIGVAAFRNCDKLTTVTFEAGSALEHLGDYSFSKCGITSMEIPEGAWYAGYSLFAESKSLASVKFPATITFLGSEKPSLEGNWMFQNCENLTSVTFAAGSTVTFFDSFMFFGCKSLTTLALPNSLNQINDNVFGGCKNLASITAPFSSAFKSVDGVLFSFDLSTLVYYPSGKAGDSYNVPEGTKIVDKYSFYEAQNLKHLFFPASVERVERAAARYCHKLETVEFAEGSKLSYVGNSAFGNNTVTESRGDSSSNLETVPISNTLRYIIFRGVTPPKMDTSSAFGWSTGDYGDYPGDFVKLKIYVPDAAADNYKAASKWSDYAKYIVPMSEFSAE